MWTLSFSHERLLMTAKVRASSSTLVGLVISLFTTLIGCWIVEGRETTHAKKMRDSSTTVPDAAMMTMR